MNPGTISRPWPFQRGSRSKGTVKAVETTFTIVECLKERGEAGVTEIAEELGVSKGTVHKHLSTLRKFGFVTAEGGTYRLGLEFYHYGSQVLDQHPLHEAARPVVDELARTTEESAWVLTHENGLGFFLHGAVETSPTLQINPGSVIGAWTYLHWNSLGKAILAHLDRSEVEWIIDTWGLPAQTEETITDPEVLFADLSQIREQGYSLNLAEDVTGIHAVGAPILVDGRAIGALSVAGAARRLTPEECKETIAPNVLAGADDIELNIVYR